VPARAENLALVAALLVCVAFIGSFLLGLGRAGPGADPVTGQLPYQEVPVPPPAGRIEVLNASGRAGMARAATDRLRGGGFDVVFFGNASGFDGDSTIVLDRTGNDAVARAVARHLGVGVVRTQRDTTLFVDATVIIGRDWR
jgi:hypothetical protein